MCGLWGYVRKPGNDKSVQFAVEAAWIVSLRGMDATGIAVGDVENGKYVPLSIFKKPVNGADFLGFRQVKNLMDDRPDWVIGHNRAGTNLTNLEIHAHPFHERNIILAHNGHIFNHAELPAKPEPAHTYIDSAKIAYSMAHAGELKTLNALRGNFALVWLNTETNTLNFARNETKPLYFAFEKGGRGLYWASEMEMLELLVNRNLIEITGDILYPEPYQWLSFPPEDVQKYKVVNFEKPPVVSLPPAKTGTHGQVGNIKMLGQKKQNKLLQNHGLKIGSVLPVVLDTYLVLNGETLATYNIADKRFKKFKSALQTGRSISELRNLLGKPAEDKLESGVIIGISGDKGALSFVISSKMDDDLEWQLPRGELSPASKDERYAYGPKGSIIPLQQFLELTAEGCALCGRILTSKDEVVWDEVSKGQYLVFCKSCGMRHNEEVA